MAKVIWRRLHRISSVLAVRDRDPLAFLGISKMSKICPSLLRNFQSKQDFDPFSRFCRAQTRCRKID